MLIQWMNKVSTDISETFVIDFGLYFGFLWRVRLFVRHFGWYLGLYFGFFTSEIISDGTCDAFRIFGCGEKNKY